MTRREFEKTPVGHPVSCDEPHHFPAEDVRMFAFILTWLMLYDSNTSLSSSSEWCAGTFADVMYDCSSLTSPQYYDPRKISCYTDDAWDSAKWSAFHISGDRPFWVGGMGNATPDVSPWNPDTKTAVTSITGYPECSDDASSVGNSSIGNRSGGPLIWFNGDWSSSKTVTSVDGITITLAYNSSTEDTDYQVGMPLRLYSATASYVYRLKSFTIDGSTITLELMDQWERDIDSLPITPTSIHCNFGGDFYTCTGFWFWKDSYVNRPYNLKAIPPRGGKWSCDRVDYGSGYTGGWARAAIPNKYHFFDKNSHRYLVGNQRRGGSNLTSGNPDFDYATWMVESWRLLPAQVDPKEQIPPIVYSDTSRPQWIYGSKVENRQAIWTNTAKLRPPYAQIDGRGTQSGTQLIFHAEPAASNYTRHYDDPTNLESGSLLGGLWEKMLPPEAEIQVWSLDSTTVSSFREAFTNPLVDQSYQSYIMWLCSRLEDTCSLEVDTDYKCNFLEKLNWRLGTSLTMENWGEDTVINSSLMVSADLYPAYAALSDPLWGCNGSGFELILKKIGHYDWWLDTQTPYTPDYILKFRDEQSAVRYDNQGEDPWYPMWWPALTLNSTSYGSEADWYMPKAVATWRRTWKYSCGRIPDVIYCSQEQGPPVGQTYNGHHTRQSRPEWVDQPWTIYLDNPDEWENEPDCQFEDHEPSTFGSDYRFSSSQATIPWPKTGWSNSTGSYVGINTYVSNPSAYTQTTYATNSYSFSALSGDSTGTRKTISGDVTSVLKEGSIVHISGDEYHIVTSRYSSSDELTQVLLDESYSGGGTLLINTYIAARHDPFMLTKDTAGDYILCYHLHHTLLKDLREVFDWLKSFKMGSSVELISMEASGIEGSPGLFGMEWSGVWIQDWSVWDRPYMLQKLFAFGGETTDTAGLVELIEKVKQYNITFIDSCYSYLQDKPVKQFESENYGEDAIYSAPASTWDPGATYRRGATVWHDGAWYYSIYCGTPENNYTDDENTGNEPGVSPKWKQFSFSVGLAGYSITINTLGDTDASTESPIGTKNIVSTDMSLKIHQKCIWTTYDFYGASVAGEEDNNATQALRYAALRIPAMDKTQQNLYKSISVDIYVGMRAQWLMWNDTENGREIITPPGTLSGTDGTTVTAPVGYFNDYGYFIPKFTKRRCTYPLNSEARYVFFQNTCRDFGFIPPSYWPYYPYFEGTNSLEIGVDCDQFYGEVEYNNVPQSVWTRDTTKSDIRPVDPNTDTKPPRPNPPVVIEYRIIARDAESGSYSRFTMYPWFRLLMRSCICEDYETLSGVTYDFALFYTDEDGEEQIILSSLNYTSNFKAYDWALDSGSNPQINAETFLQFLINSGIVALADLRVKIRARDANDNATQWSAAHTVTIEYDKFILPTGAFEIAPEHIDTDSDGIEDKIHFRVKRAFYKTGTIQYNYQYRVKYMNGSDVWYTNWVTMTAQSDRDFYINTGNVPEDWQSTLEATWPQSYGALFIAYEIRVFATGSINQGYSDPESVELAE